MKIAIAGATGRVGRHVVDVLHEQGHEVVAISRANGVDLITGDGLEAALAGVEVVIDTATGPSPDQQAATEFFTTATRNLQDAGERAGVRRIVVVSIVGIDKLTGGYNAAKLAHERAMLAGPIAVRVLRASQFHEFVAQLVEWGTQGEVSYVPQMRTQIVAARTVAEALVALATAADSELPDALITEIAGPREESMVALATALAGRRNMPVKVEGVLDGADHDAALMAEGGLLPGPDAVLAGPTFAEWLES